MAAGPSWGSGFWAQLTVGGAQAVAGTSWGLDPGLPCRGGGLGEYWAKLGSRALGDPHRGAGPRRTLGQAEGQGNKPPHPEAKPLRPPGRAGGRALGFTSSGRVPGNRRAKLRGGAPVSAEPLWGARPRSPRRGVGPCGDWIKPRGKVLIVQVGGGPPQLGGRPKRRIPPTSRTPWVVGATLVAAEPRQGEGPWVPTMEEWGPRRPTG